MNHVRFFFLVLLFPTVVQTAPAQVLIRNLVSIDIKSQDGFLDRRTRFGMSRNFHLFQDDIASATNADCTNPAAGFPERIRWNPSRNGNKFINYDELYAQMPQRNLAVLHGGAPFVHGGLTNLYGKPLCESQYINFDAHAQPVSYLSNAIRASLFAARYGSAPATGFPMGFEQIAARYVEPPDNQMGNGNGTVNYIEVFNEADGIFYDEPALMQHDLNLYPTVSTNHYCNPRQYAAMLSAAYDGNGGVNATTTDFRFKNANGTNLEPAAYWGIKNLSPSTQVVMAGVADLRREWLNQVVTQCQNMRPAGAHLPFDVVNYHFYSTTAHPGIGSSNWNYIYDGRDYANGPGQFPEKDTINLKVRLAKVLGEQNGALKSLPVWITEFGYSENDGSTKQGQWLTRYILETSAVKVDNRGIDRLFIYDLNDDLSGGSGSYAFHGLQQADGTPKKAWYHVMTMMNVLGDCSYTRNNLPPPNSPTLEQFFLNSAPSVALEPDKPRIYLYNNALKSIYALWAPTGNGTVYAGKLKLVGNWQTKPQFQRIEVLDYDEDGKRMMIPDADVDFTPGVGGQLATVYIRNLTLTETPQYLRVVNNAFNDPVVPPVINLSASCLGCQRSLLSWQNPSGSNYAYFRVYYAKTSEYPGDPAQFDPSKMHLYTGQLSGSATSIYVDLPVEEYFFWVIPFRRSLDVNIPKWVFTSPDLQNILSPANSYYVKFKPGDCTTTPCVMPLTQAQITNLTITRSDGVVMNAYGNDYYKNGFYEALIPAASANLCGEINNTAASPAPGISLVPVTLQDANTGLQVSFVVNFPTPQYLRAIQMRLQSGRAQIRIEYLTDCCNAYYLAKKHHFGGNVPQWITLNNDIPGTRIEKMRITIQAVNLAYAGVTLSRLLFCTSPAPDLCLPGQGASIPVQTTLPSDLQVTSIDTRSAVLSFWPATRTITESNVSTTEPIYLHTIRYGIAVDAQGEIVQPQEIKVYGGEYDQAIEKALSKLAPNTTYIVDVETDIPCEIRKQRSRIVFTTAAEGKKDRSEAVTLATDEVRLFPNPVKNVLHLDIPAGKYFSWRILSIQGSLLRSGVVSSTDNSINVTVQDLPPGIHIVTLFSTNGSPWSKGFLKAE